MTTFTPDAQELFDRYLTTVRWSVRGVSDPDEIERDVREHVSSALEEQESPVSSHTLRAVLAKLGDPWQWIPAEELPIWKRLLMRFSLGPEDWRLAYVTLGLTLLGLLLMPAGGFVLLVGAYLLARATYDLASDRESTLGARRWLVYPVLVFFSFMVVATLLSIGAAPVIVWGVEGHGFEKIFDQSHFNMRAEVEQVFFFLASSAVVVGTWWVILSALLAIAIRPYRWLLVPFANHLRRVHLLWLTGVGALVVGAGATVLVLGVS